MRKHRRIYIKSSSHYCKSDNIVGYRIHKNVNKAVLTTVKVKVTEGALEKTLLYLRLGGDNYKLVCYRQKLCEIFKKV